MSHAHHACAGDSLHGELPHRVRGIDFGGIASDVGGVFKGIGEGAVDTVKGVAHAVTNPVDTAKGVASLVTDPKEAWPALWHGLTNPIVEDWKAGNEGEAIGRGIFGVVEAIVGTKGVSKAVKVAKRDVPDAPRPETKPKPDVDGPRPDGDGPAPETPRGDGPVIDARTGEALTRLEDAGVKVTRANVVWADELPADSIIKTDAGVAFLETGNPNAGLHHILHGNPAKPNSPGHLQDFRNRGVEPERVPDLIREGITRGDVVKGPGRSHDVTVPFDGVEQRLRVVVGSNGFIVSAYPI